MQTSSLKLWYWTRGNRLHEVWEAYARLAEVSAPFSLFNIELTNECPMRCVMCPRTHRMPRAQGRMDFELFARIAYELAEVNLSNPGVLDGVVWLHHFGESLLHAEFARWCASACASLFCRMRRNHMPSNPVSLLGACACVTGGRSPYGLTSL